MPATRTKSATTSQYNRTQRSQSYSQPLPGDETDSSVSDASDLVIHPDAEATKFVRASQGRRTLSGKSMASNDLRRTYSDSKTYRTKDRRSTVHEMQRKSESGQRHQSHRSEGKKGGDRDETIYATKKRRSSREVADIGHPSGLRRSKTTDATSRAKHGRSHKEDNAPTRRHSEREASRHEEKRYHTPLRRERRSIADNVSRPNRDHPSTRSASVPENRLSLLFLPFLQRNRSSSQKASTSKMSTRYAATHNMPSRHMSESDVSRSRFPPYTSHPPPPTPNTHATDRVERYPTHSRGTTADERSSGARASFLGPSKPSRRPEPEKLVTCTTCLADDNPVSKCPKLSCSHRMCHDCLKRVFELSVTDSEHMPPKCCTKECIPLNHVEKLFDQKFKVKWNRKFQEFTTKNRIYCPAKGCGEWIKPSYMYRDASGKETHGRKYGVCKKCKTKVCCLCNNKWHTTRECPKDAATKDFIKLARERGWQQCYNCHATVELKEGCNHMTCKCRAQFCMCCGAPWKTCQCLMFSDEAVTADRLVHLGGVVPPPNPAAAERAHRQRIRDQEMRDEAMARRMQELNVGRNMGRRGFADFDDFGYRGAHYMDENFLLQAAEVLSAVFEPIEQAREQGEPNQAANHPAQPQPPLRQHDPAFEHYNNNRAPGRQNERIVPRRTVTDYAAEAEIHRPIATEARASLLAGMARGQVGDGRVDEWRRHVGPLP